MSMENKKFVAISSSYHLPEMEKRGYTEINVIHRALGEVFERIAFEYACRIAKDDSLSIPEKIEIEIRKEKLDLQVFIAVKEIEYENE